ncbi:hypothetical protein ACFWUP_21780 [Nocardia sp. NPDC058658]|uniref:hypothetical protein n=1 Tax=Nocardia sp. NPDC058658 TaxID=3346580 RepID=UPI003668D35A
MRQRSVWATVAVAMIGFGGAIGMVHSDNPVTGTVPVDSVAPVHPPLVPEPESMVTGTGPGCESPAIDPDAALLGPSRQPSSGAEVIAAFEASYYHARDGERARRFVAPGAAVPDAATIQAGIDSVAAGTLYCARIRLLIPGLYSVEATETSPTAPESTWQQRISTTNINGRAAITAIAAG